MWKRLIILSESLVALGFTIQVLANVRNKRLTKRTLAEFLLSWSLPINGGLLELVGFLTTGGFLDTIRGKETSKSKLHREIAVAHLAFGTLGLLSYKFRGLFWVATAIGQGIFLVGVAILHGREALRQKLFLFDVLMSSAHIFLLKVYNPLENESSPRWRRTSRR